MESTISVTTAASDFDLIGLLDVKEELGITSTTSDSKLQRWITATSQRFASICNTVFPEQVYSERFRLGAHAHAGYFRGPLLLRRQPVTAILSITEDDTALVEDTDFETDLESGLVYRLSAGNRYRWHASAVNVSYSAGYYPIPADLADAVITIIRHRWATSGRDPLLRSQTIEGVGSEAYWVPLSGGPGDLPPDLQPVKDTLDRYINLSVA